MTMLFAKALGAEVKAISRNPKKEQLATELGADLYAATDVPDLDSKFDNFVDVLINTSPSFSGSAFDKTLSMLRPRGTMIYITGPPAGENLELTPMALLKKNISVMGSQIGSVEEMQYMIEFAAKHQIKPWVETISISEKGLSEAWKRAEDVDVKFRFTMVNHNQFLKHSTSERISHHMKIA